MSPSTGQDGDRRPAPSAFPGSDGPPSAAPRERAAGRLLLALAGALALVSAAVPLALAVRSAWPPLADLDADTTRSAEAAVAASPVLLAAARAVTLLGDPWLLWLLVAGACVVLWRRGARRSVLFLVAVRLGAQVLSTGLKLAVDRSRPVFEVPVDAALGPSFPSGHTLAAAAVWTALAVVALPLVRRGLPLLAAAGAVAVCVAASRVLLGVHYVTDVVAGLLLGAGWTAVCAAVLVAWRVEEGGRARALQEGVEP